MLVTHRGAGVGVEGGDFYVAQVHADPTQVGVVWRRPVGADLLGCDAAESEEDLVGAAALLVREQSW